SPGGRLETPSASTRAAWHSLQRKVMSGPSAFRASAIPVYDLRQTLVAFATLQPYTAGSRREGASYALVVRALQCDNDIDLSAQLREIFKLTAAESTLAIALRLNGDLQRAAVSLGIAESTARTRLQAIYCKTT